MFRTTVTVKISLTTKEKPKEHELVPIVERACDGEFAAKMWKIADFEDFEVTKVKVKKCSLK